MNWLHFLWLLQEKEAMEAAVRAFEDWEFRVLERESGIDDDEDADNDAAEEGEGESEAEVQRAISCQQHVVNATQVNTISCLTWYAVLQDYLHVYVCVTCFVSSQELRITLLASAQICTH